VKQGSTGKAAGKGIAAAAVAAALAVAVAEIVVVAAAAWEGRRNKKDAMGNGTQVLTSQDMHCPHRNSCPNNGSRLFWGHVTIGYSGHD